MTLQRKVLLGLSLLLFVAFFMRWISVDLLFTQVSLTGASLPGRVRSLIGLAESVNSGSGTLAFWSLLLYLLYLIPVSAVTLAYLAGTGKRGVLALRPAAVLLGGITAALCAYLLIVLGASLVPYLAGGFWLTLLTAVALTVSGLVLPAGATGRALLTREQQADVQRLGLQALGQASSWASGKRQQVSTALEDGRLRQAVGRPLNRTLLTSQDEVLATQGSVITHALIASARNHGVLDALLGSVDRSSPGDVMTSGGTAPEQRLEHDA